MQITHTRKVGNCEKLSPVILFYLLSVPAKDWKLMILFKSFTHLHMIFYLAQRSASTPHSTKPELPFIPKFQNYISKKVQRKNAIKTLEKVVWPHQVTQESWNWQTSARRVTLVLRQKGHPQKTKSGRNQVTWHISKDGGQLRAKGLQDSSRVILVS